MFEGKHAGDENTGQRVAVPSISFGSKSKLVKYGAILVLSFVAGCAAPRSDINIVSGETPRATLNVKPLGEGAIDNGETSGPEAFSSSAYGVAASPLVATGPRVPRGGGYRKIGSSYVVKGRRYHPTENPKAVQYGRASWYGSAFHGRKTANGEIYDMNHLTGAHKTMPLPSYARVTNVRNGHSVIVRINDRGPFSNNRIIDLSKRAAEILDYTRAGTAEVKVEYVGPAPLHGRDDDYLLASIQAPGVRIGGQLPGVSGDLLSAAYTEWRIETAFDEQRFGSGERSWKRQ